MSEIKLLLQNAELRDQMEPFLDESVYLLRPERMSVRCENELLESLLTWERAPVLPIAQWFEPELILPEHHELDDSQLKQQLHQVIGRLFEKNIVLEMTDHLPDRQLYCLIARDILPSEEKKISLQGNAIRMQCLDIVDDEKNRGCVTTPRLSSDKHGRSRTISICRPASRCRSRGQCHSCKPRGVVESKAHARSQS